MTDSIVLDSSEEDDCDSETEKRQNEHTLENLGWAFNLIGAVAEIFAIQLSWFSNFAMHLS